MHQEGVCLIICVRVTCTLDSFVFRRCSGMIEITIGWAASLFVGAWCHSVLLEYERTKFMISYCGWIEGGMIDRTHSGSCSILRLKKPSF
jgi:hypothetical protein